MKRTIVASILGIAGSLAMVGVSQGQGTVYFQNYSSHVGSVVDAPVTFASSGTVAGHGAVTAGWGVGNEFNADLLYSSSGTAGSYTLLTSANAAAGGPGPAGYPAPFVYGSAGITDGPVTGASGASPGYFLGGTLQIPADTAGGTWYFIVEAYNGSSYASSVGAGMWRGQSAPLALAIATGSTPTGYLVGLSSFTVSSIPEPTTWAFAGMGALSLLGFIRRKKA